MLQNWNNCEIKDKIKVKNSKVENTQVIKNFAVCCARVCVCLPFFDDTYDSFSYKWRGAVAVVEITLACR